MTGKAEIDLAQVQSDPIRRLHDYWSSKRGDDIPAWTQIDPTDFAYALPLVFVAAIEWTPFRVYYRLVGTQATAFRGNLTDRYLDEVAHFSKAAKDQLTHEYRMTAERRRPAFWRDLVVGKSGDEHVFHAAIFPFSPAGEPVNRCLAVEDYGRCTPEDIVGFDVGIACGITWRNGC